MASIKQLEEQLAMTKDPELRRQLQALIAQRKREREKTVQGVKRYWEKEKKEFFQAIAVVAVMIWVVIILMVLLTRGC